MIQQWQRLSAAMLAACLVMGTLPAVAEEAPEEANAAQEQPTVEQSSGEGEISVVTAAKAVKAKTGTCGKKLKWKLDKQGTLTIYGSGRMKTFKIENYTAETPWNKDEIKKLVVKKGCTYISERAFSGCTQLEQVTLPNNLRKIEKHAFCGCTSLKRVKLPSALRTIRTGCFADCMSLEEVILPKKLKHIQGYAFKKCKNLDEITFPSTLEDISIRAFQQCTGLTEVYIPENVNLLNYYAFYRCDNLKEITIASKNIQTADAFRYKKEGKNYQIPAHYTVVWGSQPFQRVVERGCDYTAVGEQVLNEPIVTAGTKDNGAKIEWEYKGAFSRANIYRAEGDGEYRKYLEKTCYFDHDFNDSSCENGTWYTYKVEIQWDKYSSESKPVRRYHLKEGKITKTARKGKGGAKIYWKKNNAASGYLLRYSDTNSSKYKYVKIQNNKTTSYTVKDLLSGHDYSFDVVAYKTFGKKTYYGTWSESGWCKVV